jgi:hypothetical protein
VLHSQIRAPLIEYEAMRACEMHRINERNVALLLAAQEQENLATGIRQEIRRVARGVASGVVNNR